MKTRAAFTLFELLAVITIIGIVLAVTLGSFQGWGDAHAVRGSAEMVTAALGEARDYAVAQRVPVSFEYQTLVDDTNGVKKVAQYRLYREVSVSAATNVVALPAPSDLPQPVGTIQRLPGGVWLVNQPTGPFTADDASDRIVFLPNGRALNPTPGRAARLYVISRKMRSSTQTPNTVYQIDVNAADGTVSAVKLSTEELGQ